MRVKNCLVLLSWVALQVVLTLRADAQSSGTFQEVVTWGKKAPGGGTFFGPFLNPPVLTSTGQVYEYGLGQGFRDYPALFRWSAGVISAPVLYGEKSPGGGILTGIQNPVAVTSKWWAFEGSNSVVSLAIYRASNSQLSELAKLNAVAPGGGSFSNFGLPVVSDAGDVAFYAETTGGPGEGIYLSSSGAAPIGLALVGGLAPDGGTYSGFPFRSTNIAVNALGQTLFGADTSNGTTLVLASASGAQLVATDLAFDFVENNFSLNDSGQITYVPELDGIYFGVPSAMNQVVASGASAPGGSPGQTIAEFSNPVLNENGAIAFDAGFSTTGIYLWTGSQLELIAHLGGAPGGGIFSRSLFWPRRAAERESSSETASSFSKSLGLATL
jgi:hypothetical protein